MDKGVAPCDAVRRISAKYMAIFSSSPHAYMREKAQDVEDLSVRILNNFIYFIPLLIADCHFPSTSFK